MRRRTFVASLAGLIGSRSASAQMMHDMGTMAGKGAPPVPKPAVPVLPQGQPLRDLPRLPNESTVPGRFSATITAGPGVVRYAEGLATPVLLYDGVQPVIEATEGDRIAIRFRNGIPGQPSTIHWHGMPVPSDQDGNPMNPVASGDERVYAFDLPEGSAATYWFHPHPHNFTAEQVYRGLAGVFLVKPKVDPIPAAYGDTLLMFTDLRIAADGTMPPSTMADAMNGRVGDHVLVNGQKNPVLSVAPGEKRRIRLVNATNARYLRLGFAGARMLLVGTDGGLVETPVPVDEVMIVPGERVELIVAFDRPGEARLTTRAYARGWMGPDEPKEAGLVLLTARVSGRAAAAPPPLPPVLRRVVALGEPVVSRRLVFTEAMSRGGGMEGSHGLQDPKGMQDLKGMRDTAGMAGMGSLDGMAGMAGMEGMDMGATARSAPSPSTPPGGMGMRFLINGRSFAMGRIDEVSKVGQLESWSIVNGSDMDHPFHIHGTQFQVVDIAKAGAIRTPAIRCWKDTVNVAVGETVRIRLRQDLPGPRMYHCHILEHEELGMMGTLDVRA